MTIYDDYERITNLKGPEGRRGEKGDRGEAGVNAVANDVATAEQIADMSSETFEALKRSTALNGGLYMPTPYASLRWRHLRDATIAGRMQGHIAIVGDSIASGAAVPIPKIDHDWPGRLRALLDRQYGSAGTGIIFPDDMTFANPTWDPRIGWAGAVGQMPYGLFRVGCRRVSVGAANSLTLTATSDTTVVYTIPAGEAVLNSVTSGGTTKTISATYPGGPAPDVARNPAYEQVVTAVNWGSVAAGRVATIKPPASGTALANLLLVGVEARVSTAGTFRVSNAAVNGQSLGTLFALPNYDDGNYFYGLTMVDMIDADLLIIALGTNDWQRGDSITTLKAMLTTLIQRQRSDAAGKPFGDAMMLWNPKPDVDTFQPAVGPSWEEYRQAYYEVAAEQNVPLLDLGLLWKDEPTAALLGLMSDGIHPNAFGCHDMAAAVHRAVLSA